MLVLSRKKGEAILFGPDRDDLVQVEVVEIRGSKVRLGIHAPRHMEGVRAEVAHLLKNRVETSALTASQGTARSEARAGIKQYPPGDTAPIIETDSSRPKTVISRAVNEALLFGKARLTVLQIRGDRVRLGIECPGTWLTYRRELFEPTARPVSVSAPDGRIPRRVQPTAVAEILSRAGSLQRRRSSKNSPLVC